MQRIGLAAECKYALECRASGYCDDERAAIREICHAGVSKNVGGDPCSDCLFL